MGLGGKYLKSSRVYLSVGVGLDGVDYGPRGSDHDVKY